MKKIIFVLSCFMAGTFSSCQSNKGTATDELNTDRVVCVSKQINEIIFELGAGNHVIGTDLTSIYPEALKKLPKVGYHRLLNAEGIISLKPTLVIHDGNIAPMAVLDQLKKVGIPVKEFPEAKTIDETKGLIKQLGSLFKRDKQADSLCAKLDNDLATAAADLKQYTTKPKVIIVHFGQQSNQYLVIGKNSVGTKLIELAGGENAIDIEKGMGPLSAEVIAKAQPDIIFATDVGYDQKGSVENFKTLPGIALTPAGKNDKIYRLEEHKIMYFTPETGENVLQLMKAIHQ